LDVVAAMGRHQRAIEAYDPGNVNAVSGRTAVVQRHKL